MRLGFILKDVAVKMVQVKGWVLGISRGEMTVSRLSCNQVESAEQFPDNQLEWVTEL